MTGRFIILLVLAVVLIASGCFGRDDKVEEGAKERRICSLSTTNPLYCKTGVLVVEIFEDCRLMKCREDVNSTDKIIEDISEEYWTPKVRVSTPEESSYIALLHILNTSTYNETGGFDLKLRNRTEDSCDYCWTFNFTFSGNSKKTLNVIDEYTMSVSLEQAEIKDVKLSSTTKTCRNVYDCISRDAPLQVQITCDNSICNIRELGNVAASHCISRGGRNEVREYADNTSMGYCIFSDGSECEEWDYYKGDCAPGQEYRNCNEYYRVFNCSFEYDPVCAKIEPGTSEPIEKEWESFDNACRACRASTDRATVVGYKKGDCSQYGL